MFTMSEIDQVMDAGKLRGEPSIDFDWFDTVVEAAESSGVLPHTLETLPSGDGNVMLILIVNGVRFCSQLLIFEDEWKEDWIGEPVQDSVLRLLEIAVREIKKIETIRDTWYQPLPVGP